MELSIVTGHMDRIPSFETLYESIVKNTKDVDWEFIVSDASEKTPLELTKYERTRILPERPRLGHAAGYNKAFREAKGQYVVWLNDDCIVEPEWARVAIDFMKRNRWVGMGAIPYCTHAGNYTINEYCGMPYANFGILEREYGNSLGWFDEEVRMYGADNSLAFKVYLSGKVVRAIPGARINHRPFVDEHRIANERKQAEQAAILMNKYRGLLPEMEKTHRQFIEMVPV